MLLVYGMKVNRLTVGGLTGRWNRVRSLLKQDLLGDDKRWTRHFPNPQIPEIRSNVNGLFEESYESVVNFGGAKYRTVCLVICEVGHLNNEWPTTRYST
jgi:hypothetical protein